jgi:hypothetical protein
MDAEEALHKRGTKGWQEPVYFQGKRCGAVRKFDMHALELYLKAQDPAKYREDQGTKVGASGVVVQVNLGIQLGQQPPPKVYDLTIPVVQDEAGSVTDVLQPKPETPETRENP